MPYTDFDLDTVRQTFTLTLQTANLFPHVQPRSIPPWLQQTLEKGRPFAFGSEKARSEFMLVPVLLTVRDLAHAQVTIYSGQRLDGDAAVGLSGECDFILTLTPPLPVIQAPIISIVEAKKNDIEAGLGQCAAQMLGAQRFNLRNKTAIHTIFGCVTTGEAWQFMKLAEKMLTIHSERYYITQLGVVLDVFMQMIGDT